MIKFTPRTSRLARLWIFNFSIILAAILAAITIGGIIGYLIILAISAYGTKAVLISLLGVWILLMTGAIAGAVSDNQLLNMEKNEEDLMRKLKK